MRRFTVSQATTDSEINQAAFLLIDFFTHMAGGRRDDINVQDWRRLINIVADTQSGALTLLVARDESAFAAVGVCGGRAQRRDPAHVRPRGLPGPRRRPATRRGGRGARRLVLLGGEGECLHAPHSRGGASALGAVADLHLRHPAADLAGSIVQKGASSARMMTVATLWSGRLARR